MKNLNKFQVIVIAIFALGIIGGVAVLALTRAGVSEGGLGQVSMWGPFDTAQFNSFVAGANTKIADPLSRVKISYTQKDPLTFENELLEAIAEGRAPDLIMLPHESILSYYNRVLLLPYTAYPEGTFLDSFVEGAELFKFPGGIAALPFAIDPMVMYWNRDIFTNAGVSVPPSTWESFPALSKLISKRDENFNISQSLVAFGEYRNVENAKEMLSLLLLQRGNPIMALRGGAVVPTITNPDVPNAISFFTAFADPTNEVYSWNRALPQDKDHFLLGKLALYFGYASEAKDLRSKNPNLNFDVALLPQLESAPRKVTYGRMYGVAVLKSTPRASDALATLVALVTPDAASTWVTVSGMAPIRRDVLLERPTDRLGSISYDSALLARGWLEPKPALADMVFSNLIDSITAGKQRITEAVNRASQELEAAVAGIVF